MLHWEALTKPNSTVCPGEWNRGEHCALIRLLDGLEKMCSNKKYGKWGG